MATELEMVNFHSNPKKERQCQRMFKLLHNCTHLTCQQSIAQNSPSETSKVHELRTSRCSSWFQKRQRTRDQIATICWIIERSREFQKNIYFCFIDYTKSFDCVSSIQFSHSVVSSSLQPCGLQHARLPCPSPTSGACSNSCPSSQLCHPTISSFVIPFSSCLQSFPESVSGSFPMSQFFPPGGQSIGVSALASVFPMNTQD